MPGEGVSDNVVAKTYSQIDNLARRGVHVFDRVEGACYCSGVGRKEWIEVSVVRVDGGSAVHILVVSARRRSSVDIQSRTTERRRPWFSAE